MPELKVWLGLDKSSSLPSEVVDTVGKVVGASAVGPASTTAVVRVPGPSKDDGPVPGTSGGVSATQAAPKVSRKSSGEGGPQRKRRRTEVESLMLDSSVASLSSDSAMGRGQRTRRPPDRLQVEGSSHQRRRPTVVPPLPPAPRGRRPPDRGSIARRLRRMEGELGRGATRTATLSAAVSAHMSRTEEDGQRRGDPPDQVIQDHMDRTLGVWLDCVQSDY